MIHIVAQCHEEGLEHYLRSYVKVNSHILRLLLPIAAQHVLWMCPLQFVFKTEPFTSSTTRTVHEELAKAMTAILKPSTDFLTSNKLLKVEYLWFPKWFPRFVVSKNVLFLWLSAWYLSALQYSWYFFEALVKSMAQYLIESCRVKVSLPKHVFLTRGGWGWDCQLYDSFCRLQPAQACGQPQNNIRVVYTSEVSLKMLNWLRLFFRCEVTTSLCVALSSSTTGRRLKVTKQAKHVKINQKTMLLKWLSLSKHIHSKMVWLDKWR